MALSISGVRYGVDKRRLPVKIIPTKKLQGAGLTTTLVELQTVRQHFTPGEDRHYVRYVAGA